MQPSPSEKACPLSLLVLLPVFLSVILLLTGTPGTTNGVPAESPSMVPSMTAPQSVPQAAQSGNQDLQQPQSVATAIAAQTATTTSNPLVVPHLVSVSSFARGTYSEYRPSADQTLLTAYGDQSYIDLASMPVDLRAHTLTWLKRVSNETGVPIWAILAVWYTERWGSGFSPLETRVSSACAVGPGQITPPNWNGDWTVPYQCDPFITSLQDIPLGCGRDFDRDGYANPFSLADNIAATACNLSNSGILASNAQCTGDARLCSTLFSRALCSYLAGPRGSCAGGDNYAYVQRGIEWARQNPTEEWIFASAQCAWLPNEDRALCI